jgi:serine/threonine protein kinase
MRPVPPTVGKYQVLELLAVGGMAELYKARAHGEHGFAKLVVLKKILPHLAADPTFVQMFIDEARLTAQLDHPNIVPRLRARHRRRHAVHRDAVRRRHRRPWRSCASARGPRSGSHRSSRR